MPLLGSQILQSTVDELENPIDAAIKQRQGEDVANTSEQELPLTLSGMKTRNQLSDLDLQELTADNNRQNAARDAYAKNTQVDDQGNLNFDSPDLERELLQSGNFPQAQAQQKERLAKSQAEAPQIADRLFGLSYIQDPAQRESEYQQTKQQLAEQGYDTSTFPANYDENFVHQAVFGAMPVKDQRTLQFKPQAMQQLQQVITPPAGGWTNENRGAAAAQIAQLETKYPGISEDPDWKSSTELFKNEKPNPVFNPAFMDRARLQNLASQIGIGALPVKNYYTASQAFNQAAKEYEQYSKDPMGPGARTFQEGLINKYIQTSINKSANISNFDFLTEHFPGIQNLLDNATGKLKVGSAMSTDQVAAIMQAMRQNTVGTAEQLSPYLKQVAANNSDRPDLVQHAGPYTSDAIDAEAARIGGLKFGDELNKNPYPDALVARAKQALADPKATPAEKTQAQKIVQGIK